MSKNISLEQMVAITKMRLVNRVKEQNPGKKENYSWTDIAEAIGNILKTILDFQSNEEMHDSILMAIDNHELKDKIDDHFYEILTQPYGLDGLGKNSEEASILLNGEDPSLKDNITKLETTKIKASSAFEDNDDLEINVHLLRDQMSFMSSAEAFPYYVDGTSSILLQTRQVNSTQRDEKTGLYYEVSYPKAVIDIICNSESLPDRHIIALNIAYGLLKYIDYIYCKNTTWDFGTPILFSDPDMYEAGNISKKCIMSLIAIELVERFTTISIRELKDIICDNLYCQYKGAVKMCCSGAYYKVSQILKGEISQNSISIDKGIERHRERLASQDDYITEFVSGYFDPYFNINQ